MESSSPSGDQSSEDLSNRMQTVIMGTARFVDGKIGQAIELDGGYIDGGTTRDTCFGDLGRCRHGLSLSMWIKFNQLKDESHLFSTSASGGLQVSKL